MIKIGLCGTSGSGKGYACEKFSKYNVACIDTDRVYRENVLTSTGCINELVGYFGKDILVGGQVSKRALAEIVFGKGASAKLKMLNQITHKYIKAETLRLSQQYEKEGYSAVLIDAPVLFESGFDSMCDVTICVIAPYEEKLERIMKRDAISKEKAQARLRAQLRDSELRKRCTYVLDNRDGGDIEGQIYSIVKDLGID